MSFVVDTNRVELGQLHLAQEEMADSVSWMAHYRRCALPIYSAVVAVTICRLYVGRAQPVALGRLTRAMTVLAACWKFLVT